MIGQRTYPEQLVIQLKERAASRPVDAEHGLKYARAADDTVQNVIPIVTIHGGLKQVRQIGKRGGNQKQRDRNEIRPAGLTKRHYAARFQTGNWVFEIIPFGWICILIVDSRS